MKKEKTFVEGLTAILQKHNVLKEDEAKAAKKLFYDRSPAAFDDFLLEEGLVTRSALLNALSEYYQVPAFDVVGYFFDQQVLREFPKEFLLQNAIIPLERDENILPVIAAEPNDEDLLSEIGTQVSYDIQFMVGIRPDITDAVKEFYDISPAKDIPEDVDLHTEHLKEHDAEKILEYEEEDIERIEDDEDRL